jgi:hypothetical protein
MIVEALEMQDEGDAVERVESALNRKLSEEEKFRVKTLVRFYFSRPQEGSDSASKSVMSY